MPWRFFILDELLFPVPSPPLSFFTHPFTISASNTATFALLPAFIDFL
jgi:hypothetical protein